MAEARHSKQTPSEGIHVPFNWIWANATERGNATAEDGDLYKIGYQVDTNVIYICTNPITPTFIALTTAP